MHTKKIIFIVSLCFFLISLAFSQIYKEYDLYNITDNNIDTKKFYVGGFNNEASVLLAMAPIKELSLKRENKNYRLFFIHLNDNKIDIADIPMYNIQQYFFDENDKRLFLIGNNLTTLALINMHNYSYQEISKVEYGKKSFKFFGLIWKENDNIFTPGYFLDEKQNATDDFIVKMELINEKPNFVNTGFNITAFEKKYNPINMVILNHNKIAFVANKANMQYLGLLSKDLGMKKVDQGSTFSGLSFSDDFIFYGVKKNNKMFISLFDYNKEKLFLQKEVNFPPSYNFISKNSQTIIVGDFKPKTSKMDVYVGKKENNYELKKVIDNENLGYMKISHDGNYFMYCSKTGKIKVFKVE